MRPNPISNLKRWSRTQLLILIKKLAYSNLVQSIVWGRNETQSLVPLDIFTDSKGNGFQRLKGWRESIVPHYTRALEPQPERPRVNPEEIMNAKSAVTSMENFIQIYGYSIPYSGTFFEKSINYRGSHDLVKICSRRIKW